MYAFDIKGVPVLMLVLIVLITSLVNDSIIAGEQAISQTTQQQFVIHSKETVKPPNTNIIILLKGIGSEHHTDGIAVDNAHIVATQHETTLNLYLEIIDGIPAIAKVFG